nr:MAG TPA: hypothetical protein [Caudoviricetes sp.]
MQNCIITVLKQVMRNLQSSLGFGAIEFNVVQK